MKKIRFIDCGANIGQSAQWAIETFTNYDVTVDSFEPLPENFEKLKKKFENNEKIRVHESAVTYFDGNVTLYHQDRGALTGGSLVRGKEGLDVNRFIEVKGIDLAAWLLKNKSADEMVILKIDVEGLEYDLLTHLLNNNIQSFVDWWLVEFHQSKIPTKRPGYEENFKRKVKYFVDWGNPGSAKAAMENLGFVF